MKQLTLVAAWAIARRVTGLSVVPPKSSDAEKGKLFSLGQMASDFLLLVQTHARTNVTLVYNDWSVISHYFMIILLSNEILDISPAAARWCLNCRDGV
jgi:hypothetical protein